MVIKFVCCNGTTKIVKFDSISLSESSGDNPGILMINDLIVNCGNEEKECLEVIEHALKTDSTYLDISKFPNFINETRTV